MRKKREIRAIIPSEGEELKTVFWSPFLGTLQASHPFEGYELIRIVQIFQEWTKQFKDALKYEGTKVEQLQAGTYEQEWAKTLTPNEKEMLDWLACNPGWRSPGEIAQFKDVPEHWGPKRCATLAAKKILKRSEKGNYMICSDFKWPPPEKEPEHDHAQGF